MHVNSVSKKLLEIRVSQNLAKLGGVHKMSGMEGVVG